MHAEVSNMVLNASMHVSNTMLSGWKVLGEEGADGAMVLVGRGTNDSGGSVQLLRQGCGRFSVLGQSCLRKGSSENELQWLPCPA